MFRHAMPGALSSVDADPAREARREELSRRAIAVLQTADHVFDRGARHAGNGSDAAAGVDR